MDSVWTWALVSIAIVTMLLSYRVQHAWLWIGCGGASFFASTLFLDISHRVDLHPIVTLACDALVCLSISRWYKKEWELGVYVAFLASVFSSLLVLGGFIKDPVLYASILETCNLGALLWIGTTGIVDMVGKDEHSRLHTFRCTLYQSRVRAR